MGDVQADEAFQSLLVSFRANYARDSETYRKRMKNVVLFLSDEKDGLGGYQIKHPAISFRLKTVDSAVKSIKRRQKERTERRTLKALVEERGESWAEYCERWNESDKANEIEPFTTLEEIHSAVADLAGVRVSLYLPGDVIKAKEFIEKHIKTLVHVRTHHKTDRDPRVPSLSRRIEDERKKLEDQAQGKADASNSGIAEEFVNRPQPNTRFSGYSAYHVIVKVAREHIEDYVGGNERPGENMFIEVQIATAVMHAWQGVEHDIIYKNLGSEKPSDDEVRLINLFNGIILSGEQVLEQLEATRIRQQKESISKGEEPVRYTWQLEAIIAERYRIDRQSRPIEAWWNQLNQLLGVLEATGQQSADSVRAIFSEVKGPTGAMETFDAHVPLRMLEQLCKSRVQTINIQREPSVGEIYAKARAWALRLVHTLNMAVYFNIARVLIVQMRSRKDFPRNLPTLEDFLCILHPQHTQSSPKAQKQIIRFSQWMIDHMPEVKLDDYGAEARIRLAYTLPDKCLIVWPKIRDPSSTYMFPRNGAAVVPTWLMTLLYFNEPISRGKRRESRLVTTLPSGPSALEHQQEFFVPILGSVPGSGKLDSQRPVIEILDMAQRDADTSDAGKMDVDEAKVEESDSATDSPDSLADVVAPQKRWELVHGEQLGPWDIKEVDFMDSLPGFKTKVKSYAEEKERTKYQRLACRVGMETTELYQLAREVGQSVLGGDLYEAHENEESRGGSERRVRRYEEHLYDYPRAQEPRIYVADRHSSSSIRPEGKYVVRSKGRQKRASHTGIGSRDFEEEDWPVYEVRGLHYGRLS